LTACCEEINGSSSIFFRWKFHRLYIKSSTVFQRCPAIV